MDYSTVEKSIAIAALFMTPAKLEAYTKALRIEWLKSQIAECEVVFEMYEYKYTKEQAPIRNNAAKRIPILKQRLNELIKAA